MEKKDYKHGRFEIINTDPCQFDESDYNQWCEDNEEEDIVDFYEWCSWQAYDYLNDDMVNISNCGAYHTPVALYGNLGLWWGEPSIKPMRFDSVSMALSHIIYHCDNAIIKAYYDDGKIEVEVSHHDGVHHLKIQALNKRGVSKVSNDFKANDFKRLPYLYAIGRAEQ